MILYFIGLIYILNQIGFWEVRLLKDSVIWYLTVAFVTTFRSTTKARDLGFFYLFLKDNIKIIVVFEFIMNMYTFSVLIEFILVFAITFFSILISFIHSSPKYQDKNSKILKNFFNTLLSILVLTIFINSVRKFILEFENLIILDVLKDVMLPIALSLLFVFYIYAFVVVVSYETLLMGIKRLKTIQDSLRPKLILKVLIFCNINIVRIKNFIHWSGVFKNYINNDQDIKNLFRRYKETKEIKRSQEGSNFS